MQIDAAQIQNNNLMQEKLKLLKDRLAGYDHLAVAFSGGVNSTFLLLCAQEVLGENVMAVTVTAPHFFRDELDTARRLCEKKEIPHLIINMPEDVFESIAPNPPIRCFLCKRSQLSIMKSSLGPVPLADACDADEDSDCRPGRKAYREQRVLRPLAEIGFTKREIRTALKAMNVPTWSRPSDSCLASRIPYGTRLSPEKMNALDKVENFIRRLGFDRVRARPLGELLLIELPPEARERFATQQNLDAVNKEIKKAGYLYAALDMEGSDIGRL